MGCLAEACKQNGLTLQSNNSRSGSKGHDSSHPNAALAFQQPSSVARERQPAARRKQRSEPHKQNNWHYKRQEQLHHQMPLRPGFQ